MKKFKMIDEKFICENCGYEVDKLNYTARDHCPNCLWSKHVDINPGDRLNDCKTQYSFADISRAGAVPGGDGGRRCYRIVANRFRFAAWKCCVGFA